MCLQISCQNMSHCTWENYFNPGYTPDVCNLFMKTSYIHCWGFNADRAVEVDIKFWWESISELKVIRQYFTQPNSFGSVFDKIL